jgi:hypothetical protein
MIRTSPEHFYKRKLVASGAALPIVAELPDLSLDATGKDLILSTGDRNRFAIISGNTDIEVKNGSYDLVGGYLRTFVSGTSMGETGVSPTIKLYGLKQDYPIREGDITLPDNSNDRPSMAAYHQTFEDGDQIYQQEDFDGALTTLDKTGKFLMGGFNSKPYMEVEHFLDYYSNLSSKSEDKILQGLVSTGCITMQWTEGTTTFATDNPRSGRIFLRKVTKDDFGGTDPGTYWAPVWKRTDGTTGLECDWKIKTPYIGPDGNTYGSAPVIQYADFNTMGDIETEERISTNNTIFTTVKTTRQSQNPWSADTKNPLIYSRVNLEPGPNGSTGKSAHFYHSWDAVSGNRQIEEKLGRQNNFGGQVAMASILNMPMPLTTDCGHDRLGDQRSYFPSICMNMRIDKLLPNPYYNLQQTTRYGGANSNLGIYGAVTDTAASSRGNQITQGIAATSDGPWFGETNLQAESLLRTVAIVFSNYEPPENCHTLDEFLNFGLTNFYGHSNTQNGIVGGLMFKTYGMAYNDTGSNQDNQDIWPSFSSSQIVVQALPVQPLADLSGSSASQGQHSRSCDTVSGNPEITTSSSSLIRVGQYVTGTGVPAGTACVVAEITAGSVGAVTKFKLGRADAYATGSTTYVNADNTSSGGVTLTFKVGASSGKLWRDSGFARLHDGDNTYVYTTNQFRGGISAGDYTEDKYLLRLATAPWIQAYNAQADWAQRPFFQTVEMNKDFKVEFFIDPLAYNTTTSSSLTPYKNLDVVSTSDDRQKINSGVAMRAIFSSPELTPTGSATGTGGSSSYTQQKFIDIPFPAKVITGRTGMNNYRFIDRCQGENGDAITTDTDGSTAKTYYPRHMTIWVNGYRWVQGYNNTRRDLMTSNTDFYYGDVDGEGATTETEVWIDNIIFKNFTPDVKNMTSTQPANPPLALRASGKINSPVFYPTGSSLARAITGFDSATDPAENNTAGFIERTPSNSILFGWDNKTDLSLSDTNMRGSYLLFNEFSTLNFNNLNKFNYPMYTHTPDGLLSMNQSTNELDKMGGQFLASVYVSGTTQADWIPTGSALSGASFNVTDGTQTQNALSIASGSNDFLSVDALQQKGYAYLSVSGAAGGAAIDYGGWSKREHAAVSTKVIRYPQYYNGLNGNQLVVENPDIFNQYQNDEYILYRAYGTFQDNEYRILKLAQKNPIDGTTITFSENVNTAASGNLLCTDDTLPELYISPYKYWVSMIYTNDSKFGDSNNQQLIPRSYGNVMEVKNTPSSQGTGSQGTTFNEYIYSYNKNASNKTGGNMGIYTNRWDLAVSSVSSDLILEKDFGFGAWDEELKKGGNLAQATPVESSYIDFDFSEAVKQGTYSSNQTFLHYMVLEGPTKEQETTLFNPAASTFEVYVPRYYLEYQDKLPTKPELTATSTVDILSPDLNLYDLTSENLNSVKFNWSEQDDDIWYRYFIVSSGAVQNKYAHARLWMPLNEQPADQNLWNPLDNKYYVYDAVSGTSAAVQNGEGLFYGITALGSTGAADGSRSAGTYNLTPADYLTDTEQSNVPSTYASGANLQVVVNGAGAATASITNNGGEGYFVKIGSTTLSNAVIITIPDAKLGDGGGADLVIGASPANTVTTNKGIVSDLIGVSNWAPEFDQLEYGYLVVPSGTNFSFPMGSTADTEEFSIVAHFTPETSLLGDSASTAQYNYIMSKSYSSVGGSLSNGFAMFISGANTNAPYIIFKHGTTEFKSKTPIDIDGSAFNVIYTYKKNSNTGPDGRLYVNGVLEAYKESTDDLSTTDKDLIIGSVLSGSSSTVKYTNQSFRGSIEEIIFYDTELIVPQQTKEYIYNTSDLLDKDSSGNLITHNTRLFLFDYHNIRGKSEKEVAFSNQVAWRATV